MRFYSLDVETANPDQSSICQIGAEIFGHGKLVESWKEFANGGHNLKHLAYCLDIEFQHHDALEDAIACGKIAIKACEKNNVDILDYLNNY
jgi:DNA polymerase III epsilon subunit-like protein